MKVRVLLFLAILFVSTAASAQVTLTDEASGMSVTLAGNWTMVENEGAAVAANEEGCMFVLTAVPAAEAEAAVNDLDSFLGSFITDAAVTESGMDETGTAFAATGTGMADGEAVEWVIAGGVDGGYFGMVFAAASATATTCSEEMGAVLNSL